MLSEAVQELNVSRALMPENPFVTAVGLDVHTVALVDAMETNSSVTSYSESAAEYANELVAKYPDYLYGRITRARYFAAIDDPVMALAEWKTARKHGGGGLVDSCIVCLQTRIGDAAYRQKDAMTSAWQGVLSGNRTETLRLVDIQETTSVLGCLWSNGYIRRLCGAEQGVEVLERIEESPVAKPKWLENPLRLFLGRVSPEQLLADLRDKPNSRFWTAHTHFCVAMEFLYRDDLDKAEKHLQECIRANSWETDLHHAAIGFLNRLQKGDDWPESLRVAR